MASAFAKIGRLELLKRLFSKHTLAITPMIRGELTVSLDYGYTFPREIFKQFEVIYPSEKEIQEYLQLQVEERSLGKGELEAICICKSRKALFSSLDQAALRFAREAEVETLELHSILRALWVSGLQSKEEVKEVIMAIEDKDNTRIVDTDIIFEEG
jgi:predicted nucleic acid-binding protein